MSLETESHEAKTDGHPLIWSITAILFIALLAAAGYKYREHMQGTTIATAPLDQHCMLNMQQCTSRLPDGGGASLTIAPHPIVAATPMQVSLQLEGLEAQGVEIHFRGESMNMGINQFILTHNSAGNYSGEVILPVCVRSSMIWIADVVVATPKRKIVFPFRFESIHP